MTTTNRRRTQRNHGILSKIKPFLFNFQNLLVGFSFPFSFDFENNHVMYSKWTLEDAQRNSMMATSMQMKCLKSTKLGDFEDIFSIFWIEKSDHMMNN